MQIYKIIKTLSISEPVGNWKDCCQEIPFDESLLSDKSLLSDLISKIFETAISFKQMEVTNVICQEYFVNYEFHFSFNKDNAIVAIDNKDISTLFETISKNNAIVAIDDKDIGIWFETIKFDTQNKEKIDKCAQKLYNAISENKNKIIFEKETSYKEKFITYYLLKKITICCNLEKYNLSESELSFSFTLFNIENIKSELAKFENDETEVRE